MADREQTGLRARQRSSRRGLSEMHELGRHRRRLELERRGAAVAWAGRRRLCRREAAGRASPFCRSATAMSASTSRPTRTRRHPRARRSPRSTRCRRSPPLSSIPATSPICPRTEQCDDADQVIEGAKSRSFCHSRRARCRRRRQRQGLSRPLWQGHPGQGLVQLRLWRRAFYRADQRFQFRSPASNPPASRKLGDDQLEWMEKDVAGLSASTPIVVLRASAAVDDLRRIGAGAPQDAGRALGYLKRFGSVTVLNGHIHQIMQKVEGNVTFHTAVDRISAAGARNRPLARADEGAGRAVAQIPRGAHRQLCPRQRRSALIDRRRSAPEEQRHVVPKAAGPQACAGLALGAVGLVGLVAASFRRSVQSGAMLRQRLSRRRSASTISISPRRPWSSRRGRR